MARPTRGRGSGVDKFFAEMGALTQQETAKPTTSKSTGDGDREGVDAFFDQMKALSLRKPAGPTTCETHRYSLEKFFKDAKIAGGELDEIASILVKSTKHLESKCGWFTKEADEAMQQNISRIGKDLIKILISWSKQDVRKHYKDREKFGVTKGLCEGHTVGALIAQRMEKEELARLEEITNNQASSEDSMDWSVIWDIAQTGLKAYYKELSYEEATETEEGSIGSVEVLKRATDSKGKGSFKDEVVNWAAIADKVLETYHRELNYEEAKLTTRTAPVEMAKRDPPVIGEEGYDDKLANWGMNWDITEKVLQADRKGLSQRVNDAPFWLIETMGVLPESRGRGVGRALLKEVQSQATKGNIAVMVIADYEAVGFYAKCGFEKVGEIHYNLPKYQPSTMMRWLPITLKKT
ncbi:hypothetical protein F4779DRAFT_621999 [Xylariaceae sp. FL0662B]|nr:hypothetical protein F4779DRAFT_621999 [Xylariaceae sp. FL0662B]